MAAHACERQHVRLNAVPPEGSAAENASTIGGSPFVVVGQCFDRHRWGRSSAGR